VGTWVDVTSLPPAWHQRFGTLPAPGQARGRSKEPPKGECLSISLSSGQLEFKLHNATHYSLGQVAASNKDFRKIVQEHKNRPWPALTSKRAFPRHDSSTTVNRQPARHWDNLRIGVMLHGRRFIIRRRRCSCLAVLYERQRSTLYLRLHRMIA
jgi:hypothetical protein